MPKLPAMPEQPPSRTSVSVPIRSSPVLSAALPVSADDGWQCGWTSARPPIFGTVATFSATNSDRDVARAPNWVPAAPRATNSEARHGKTNEVLDAGDSRRRRYTKRPAPGTGPSPMAGAGTVGGGAEGDWIPAAMSRWRRSESAFM
jgi:hypothetical protein